MAAGDLTVRMEGSYAGDFKQLSDAVNTTGPADAVGAASRLEATRGPWPPPRKSCRRPASRSRPTPKKPRRRRRTVAEAGGQVNTNLQTLSSGAEEMNATIGEIAKNATEAAQGGRRGGGGRRIDQPDGRQAGRVERRDREGHRGHHFDCAADQPAGAERDHRGGARRRGRQGLRGGRQRGQGTGQADGQSHRGDQGQDHASFRKTRRERSARSAGIRE